MNINELHLLQQCNVAHTSRDFQFTAKLNSAYTGDFTELLCNEVTQKQ